MTIVAEGGNARADALAARPRLPHRPGILLQSAGGGGRPAAGNRAFGNTLERLNYLLKIISRYHFIGPEVINEMQRSGLNW
jgi:hypothetical protein